MPDLREQESLDPMRTMWEALERAGCKPYGQPHSFRAQCPAHGGGNRDSLGINEGADRRVLVRCLVRCETRQVLDALGLNWGALFPPGHRSGEKRKPTPVRSLTAGPAFLDTLTLAGFRWAAHIMRTTCPFCSNPHAYLTVHDRGGLDVACPDGCTEAEVRGAVETRAAIAERADDLRRSAA